MALWPAETAEPQQSQFAGASSGLAETAPEKCAETLLVRTFAQEAHTAALMTATAASAINYTHNTGTVGPFIEARKLIAGYNVQIEHWPQRILAEQLSHETVKLVADFYAAIRRGKAALLDFEMDSSELGIERAALLHIINLSTIWRQAARHARAVINVLNTQVDVPEENRKSGAQLAELLTRVIDGDPTCCLADGKLVIPQLAERRRAQRQSLLQPATIRTSKREVSAFARDISAGGIGLTHAPPLEPGLRVNIELACGRSFRGSIAWSNGGEAGVTFDQPLSPTDPLIFG